MSGCLPRDYRFKKYKELKAPCPFCQSHDIEMSVTCESMCDDEYTSRVIETTCILLLQ